MKKTFILLLSIVCIVSANAQISSLFAKKKKTTETQKTVKPVVVQEPKKIETPKKDWTKIDFSKRPADHFMFQYGSDFLLSHPDSIKTKGSSRHFNFYAMIDKPMKNNPKFSIAYGLGIGSSNLFFDREYVKVAGTGSTLAFDSTTTFKKSKVTTFYVEAPVEIRYFSDPEHPGKSWKAAFGIKPGFLLKSYFKGKNLQDRNGNSVYGSTYILKESSTRFINSTLVALTARVGYGNISLHTDFQLTSFLKSAAGPDLHTMSIGITVSGL